MQQDIKKIQELLPETRLIFSGIAARKLWANARHPAALNKSRIRINIAMKKFMEENGGEVILHNNIASKDKGIFKWDGVHFNDKGNDLFLGNIQKGLREML